MLNISNQSANSQNSAGNAANNNANITARDFLKKHTLPVLGSLSIFCSFIANMSSIYGDVSEEGAGEEERRQKECFSSEFRNYLKSLKGIQAEVGCNFDEAKSTSLIDRDRQLKLYARLFNASIEEKQGIQEKFPEVYREGNVKDATNISFSGVSVEITEEEIHSIKRDIAFWDMLAKVELPDVQKLAQERIDELGREIGIIDREITGIKEKITGIEGQIAQIDSQIAANTQQEERLDSEIDKCETAQRGAEEILGSIGDLKTQLLAIHRDKVHATSSKLASENVKSLLPKVSAALKIRVEGDRKQNEEVIEELGQIEEKCEDFSTRSVEEDRLKSRIVKRETEQKRAEEILGSIGDLQTQLSAIDKAYASLEELAFGGVESLLPNVSAALAIRVEGDRKQNTRLREERGQIEKKGEDLNGELDVLNGQLDAAKDKKTKLESGLSDLENEKTYLGRHVEDLSPRQALQTENDSAMHLEQERVKELVTMFPEETVEKFRAFVNICVENEDIESRFAGLGLKLPASQVGEMCAQLPKTNFKESDFVMEIEGAGPELIYSVEDLSNLQCFREFIAKLHQEKQASGESTQLPPIQNPIVDQRNTAVEMYHVMRYMQERAKAELRFFKENLQELMRRSNQSVSSRNSGTTGVSATLPSCLKLNYRPTPQAFSASLYSIGKQYFNGLGAGASAVMHVLVGMSFLGISLKKNADFAAEYTAKELAIFALPILLGHYLVWGDRTQKLIALSKSSIICLLSLLVVCGASIPSETLRGMTGLALSVGLIGSSALLIAKNFSSRWVKLFSTVPLSEKLQMLCEMALISSIMTTGAHVLYSKTLVANAFFSPQNCATILTWASKANLYLVLPVLVIAAIYFVMEYWRNEKNINTKNWLTQLLFHATRAFIIGSIALYAFQGLSKGSDMKTTARATGQIIINMADFLFVKPFIAAKDSWYRGGIIERNVEKLGQFLINSAPKARHMPTVVGSAITFVFSTIFFALPNAVINARLLEQGYYDPYCDYSIIKNTWNKWRYAVESVLSFSSFMEIFDDIGLTNSGFSLYQLFAKFFVKSGSNIEAKHYWRRQFIRDKSIVMEGARADRETFNQLMIAKHQFLYQVIPFLAVPMVATAATLGYTQVAMGVVLGTWAAGFAYKVIKNVYNIWVEDFVYALKYQAANVPNSTSINHIVACNILVPFVVVLSLVLAKYGALWALGGGAVSFFVLPALLRLVDNATNLQLHGYRNQDEQKVQQQNSVSDKWRNLYNQFCSGREVANPKAAQGQGVQEMEKNLSNLKEEFLKIIKANTRHELSALKYINTTSINTIDLSGNIDQIDQRSKNTFTAQFVNNAKSMVSNLAHKKTTYAEIMQEGGVLLTSSKAELGWAQIDTRAGAQVLELKKADKPNDAQTVINQKVGKSLSDFLKNKVNKLVAENDLMQKEILESFRQLEKTLLEGKYSEALSAIQEELTAEQSALDELQHKINTYNLADAENLSDVLELMYEFMAQVEKISNSAEACSNIVTELYMQKALVKQSAFLSICFSGAQVALPLAYCLSFVENEGRAALPI